jgi:hypothetical protein
VVLHVPDTHDRYYVLQFVDAWTNNFAYIGRRATGTAEAEYLLTDGADDGPVPDGMQVVAAPSGVFSIVGRVQVDGEADAPAVRALQDQFTLTPWRCVRAMRPLPRWPVSPSRMRASVTTFAGGSSSGSRWRPSPRPQPTDSSWRLPSGWG